MTTASHNSVIQRVTGILNLFSASRPLITIDDIASCLDISTASAYRYAAELSQSGLLSPSAGRYRLGPKIIELEYLIRSYDPIIQAGHPLMTGLAELTGCDVLLCNVYDTHIVNVHHIRGEQALGITYTKGLPMPLFRGSQARIVLAHMDRRKLKRLYEHAIDDPRLNADVRQLGDDWQSFSKTLKQIRGQGYYISREELDREVVGIAAPIFGENNDIQASLVIGKHSRLPSRLSEAALINLAIETAKEISRRIGSATGSETRDGPSVKD